MANVIEDVMKVCRLCLGNDRLIWVFDNRIETHENMKDVIQITTGVTITPLDNVSQMLCFKCLNITIKMFKFRSSSIVNDNELKVMAAKKRNPKINKSVELLLEKYPKIVLPSSITKCDIAPKVMVNRNDVSIWRENNRMRRKLAKTKRKELKKLETGKLEMDVDLENQIMPHLIPFSDVSTKAQPSESTSEDSPPKLEVSPSQISPVLPELASKVDDNQNLSQPKSSTQTSQTEDSKNSSEDKISKRKLSSDSNSPSSKKFKSVVNNENDNSADSLVTVKYVNKSLFICDICNSILYTAKDLRKHKMKHMRCILCKKSFPTMEETKHHNENSCQIKQIMNNLPMINLIRCDEVQKIRDQFASAFQTSSSKEIENVVLRPDSPEGSNTNEDLNSDPLAIENVDIKPVPLPLDSTGEPQTVCQILLISDDENDNKRSKILEETSSSNNNISLKPKDNEPKNDTDISSSDKKSKISSTKKNVMRPTNNSKLEKKNSDISSSIDSVIKPEIQIVGENIIDVNLNDNDINLLKNILKQTRKTIKETSIQTDMPNNSEIEPSLSKDKLFELKNLRKFLNYYKIPVNVSFATQYAVRYGYDPSPLLKKDRSWSKVNMKVVTTQKPPSLNRTVQNCSSKVPGKKQVSSNSSVGTPSTMPATVTIPSSMPIGITNNLTNGIQPIASTAQSNSFQNSFIHSISGSVPQTNLTNQKSYFRTNHPHTSVFNQTLVNNIPRQSPAVPSFLLNQQPDKNIRIILKNGSDNILQSTTKSNIRTPSTMTTTSVNNGITSPTFNRILDYRFNQDMPSPTINNVFSSTVNKVPSTSVNMSMASVDNNFLVSSVSNMVPSHVYKSQIPPPPVTHSMPPPLHTYARQRLTSVMKPNTNNMQGAQPQSGKDSATPSATATFSTFVPVIRVKNVSELR